MPDWGGHSNSPERPFKDAQFFAKSRKTKILATGIHGVFRGLKSEADAELVKKGACFKGLSKGFTLLEVLVALIIIGISLGTVFQAFSQSKTIAWKSDEKAEGARITQNILANSALIRAAIKEKGKKGVVEGEDQWEYRISVQPLELEAKAQEEWIEIPSMLKLDLLLVHNTGQREKAFRLHRWYRR